MPVVIGGAGNSKGVQEASKKKGGREVLRWRKGMENMREGWCANKFEKHGIGKTKKTVYAMIAHVRWLNGHDVRKVNVGYIEDALPASFGGDVVGDARNRKGASMELLCERKAGR